jgi:putative ABC transport system permease protein
MMWLTHIKSAYRRLLTQRLGTAIHLVGLSVAMTASILIFLWVQNELSYDKSVPGYANIYRITDHFKFGDDPAHTSEGIPLRMEPFIRAQVPGIKQMGVLLSMTHQAPIVKVGNQVYRETKTAFVDSGWLSMFPRSLMKGSINDFLEDPNSVLITETTAKKYFGSSEPIGQTITIGNLIYTIRGVTRDNPSNSSFDFDLLPNEQSRMQDSVLRKTDMMWPAFRTVTFVQLAKGADTASIGRTITSVYKSERKVNSNGIWFTLLGLQDIHFESNISFAFLPHGGDKTMVNIFIVLGILILVIASINYINLTTARASTRSKEVGVRKVIGAGRFQLIMQFVAESALVGFLALIITLVTVHCCIPYMNNLTGQHYDASFGNPRIWEITGSVLVALVMLNSIYPALLLSSFRPSQVLSGQSVWQAKDGFFRKGLVVFQFSVAMVILVGTLIIDKQMDYVRLHSPAFTQTQLLQIKNPYQYGLEYKGDPKSLAQMTRNFGSSLSGTPGIGRVSLASEALISMEHTNTGMVSYPGLDEKTTSLQSTELKADPIFKELFHLELKEGQWLTGNPQFDRKHYVINETAIKDWGLKEPVLGQQIYLEEDTGQIVGVIKDFAFNSMHGQITPLIARGTTGEEGVWLAEVKPGMSDLAIASARKLFHQYYPDMPFEYGFVNDSFNTLYKNDLNSARLFMDFSWMAVLISALGLLGLAAFTAEQRTREIGIRKVLGASVSQLMLLLSGSFVGLVLLGVLIGAPIAWWAGHLWLQGFVYRTSIGVWMFVLPAMAAIFIALLTISIQTLQAARANPVKSLRTE